ncbi:hypothetical protein D3C81_1300060 [compost metagenome]
MQADRLPYRLGQQIAQQPRAELLVAQVLLVDDRRVFVQVADVVEQGGDHQAVGATRPFGQGRALQGMLRLADGLAVGFRAVAGEAFGQFVEEAVAGVFHGDSPCGRG